MDAEFEMGVIKSPENSPSAERLEDTLLDADLGPRSKTSLRMHYEAQVAVIQKQAGNLEEIRASLGLSQRKMAQLLLVDPSAWTRWTKLGNEAPPHIWRALQWYMALREKIPGLTPQYFISTHPQVLHQKALKEVETERQERLGDTAHIVSQLQALANERDDLQRDLRSVKKDLHFHKKMTIILLLTSLFSSALLWFWKVI